MTLQRLADQWHPVVGARKYMSVLSTKIVGEPKPPRAITSSMLALELVLDHLLADAFEEFDVVDADLLADIR